MTTPLSPEKRRRQLWITLFLALIFLLPAMFGFGTKLFSLIYLVQNQFQPVAEKVEGETEHERQANRLRDPEGAFAIAPLLAYVLISIGFFFLMIWAMYHGIFQDIEAPKYTFLETEEMLDREDHFHLMHADHT